MKKLKQIAAVIGIVLIVSMYLVTLISAFFTTKYTNALFTASLFCTIAVPVFLYAFMLIYKLVHKKDETMFLSQLKKQEDTKSSDQ